MNKKARTLARRRVLSLDYQQQVSGTAKYSLLAIKIPGYPPAPQDFGHLYIECHLYLFCLRQTNLHASKSTSR